MKKILGLKKEFEISKEKSPIIFLIVNGYLCGMQSYSENFISVIYSSLSLTDKTRNILGEYKEEGHRIYDIIRNELKPEQIEQIKTWFLAEGKTEKVMNRIKKEIFHWNVPEVKTNEIEEDNDR